MTQTIQIPSPLQFLALHELRKPHTGSEIAEKLGKRKGTGILTPGTIYPALKDLHKKKLVSYRSDGRSKKYTLTKKGEQELDQLYKEFSQLFRGLRHKIRPMK